MDAGETFVKVKRRSGPKSKTSPYIGVTQYKKTLRWECHIWLASDKGKGCQRHLGSYESAEEAARCYDRAALKTRGDQAELNFPNTDYKNDDPFIKQYKHLSREAFFKQLRETFAIKSTPVAPPRPRPKPRPAATAGGSSSAAGAADGSAPRQHAVAVSRPPPGVLAAARAAARLVPGPAQPLSSSSPSAASTHHSDEEEEEEGEEQEQQEEEVSQLFGAGAGGLDHLEDELLLHNTGFQGVELEEAPLWPPTLAPQQRPPVHRSFTSPSPLPTLSTLDDCFPEVQPQKVRRVATFSGGPPSSGGGWRGAEGFAAACRGGGMGGGTGLAGLHGSLGGGLGASFGLASLSGLSGGSALGGLQGGQGGFGLGSMQAGAGGGVPSMPGGLAMLPPVSAPPLAPFVPLALEDPPGPLGGGLLWGL